MQLRKVETIGHETNKFIWSHFFWLGLHVLVRKEEEEEEEEEEEGEGEEDQTKVCFHLEIMGILDS